MTDGFREIGTSSADRFHDWIDVDQFGVDGFMYESSWTLGHPLQGIIGRCTLARIALLMPFGAQFKIYIVAGHDRDGMPHVDITLSEKIAQQLSVALAKSRITIILNSELWDDDELD